MPTKRQVLDNLQAFPLPHKVDSLEGMSFRHWLIGMIASSPLSQQQSAKEIVSLADRIIELLADE
jgi:hypothetical protein